MKKKHKFKYMLHFLYVSHIIIIINFYRLDFYTSQFVKNSIIQKNERIFKNILF